MEHHKWLPEFNWKPLKCVLNIKMSNISTFIEFFFTDLQLAIYFALNEKRN